MQQDRHDDVLAAIDAALDETLETLFPPDDTLDPHLVELILGREIEVDGEDPDDPFGLAEPEDDPFGLYEAAWLYAAWVARRDHRGTFLVYGVDCSNVCFVAKPLAHAIDVALPHIDATRADWEQCVPWVQQQQDQFLPHDVVERYGTWGASMVDGPVVQFAAADLDAILTALEPYGIHCERDDALVLRVAG